MRLRFPSLPVAAAVLLACAALAGCKLVPTPAEGTAAAGKQFNPDQAAADMWDAKVVPYLRGKAGTFSDVQALAKTDAAAAGAKFGNPRKQANAPWTFAVSLEGKIVAANTESRAATIDIDADGDGKADARVQIGPAVRGTALRDSLDFVDFNQFTNQIDFAQFGKSLNVHANRVVLEKLPRDALVGRTASVLGAYSVPAGADLPLIAAADVQIGPKP